MRLPAVGTARSQSASEPLKEDRPSQGQQEAPGDVHPYLSLTALSTVPGTS